jgi:hypothetical protein
MPPILLVLVVAVKVISLDSPGQKEVELGVKVNCAFASDSKRTFRITNNKERVADLRKDTVIKRCVLGKKEGDAADADAS